jgi:hypothetical protein
MAVPLMGVRIELYKRNMEEEYRQRSLNCCDLLRVKHYMIIKERKKLQQQQKTRLIQFKWQYCAL